jgi:hypothetical protein
VGNGDCIGRTTLFFTEGMSCPGAARP